MPGEQFSRKRGSLGKYIDIFFFFFLHTKPYISYASCEYGNILSKPMITNAAAYGLSLYHTFFRSIQETQCEWNKNIFGERGLGNWPQEINTTKIAQNVNVC
jgi:hypothetical protein